MKQYLVIVPEGPAPSKITADAVEVGSDGFLYFYKKIENPDQPKFPQHETVAVFKDWKYVRLFPALPDAVRDASDAGTGDVDK